MPLKKETKKLSSKFKNGRSSKTRPQYNAKSHQESDVNFGNTYHEDEFSQYEDFQMTDRGRYKNTDEDYDYQDELNFSDRKRNAEEWNEENEENKKTNYRNNGRATRSRRHRSAKEDMTYPDLH